MMILFIFIYVKKKRDEIGQKRGNIGSWTKEVIQVVNLVHAGSTEFIDWIMREMAY